MTESGKVRAANAMSWLTLFMVLAGLAVLVQVLGCGTLVGKRPTSAPELQSQTAIISGAARSLAKAAVIEHLKDVDRIDDPQAQAWALRAQALARCGAVLAASGAVSDIDSIESFVSYMIDTIESRTARDETWGDYWQPLVRKAPWWVVSEDPRDRAALATFCEAGERGILDGWADVKKRKGW